MARRPLEPELIRALREGYPLRRLGQDLTAGLLVGIVALPLSIAIAVASGVKPEQGLYTAIVAGFVVSALGGSRYQIGGPTGAFIVLVAHVVQEHGYEGLAVATLMAGVILVLMGLARLGAVIQYIPYPVTVGFTGGIAVLIFSSQVRDLLGLPMGAVPPDFLERVGALATHLRGADPATVAVGLGSWLLIVLWPRVTRKVPGSLIAVLVATVAVAVTGVPVETIGSRFGAVPTSLPMPHVPRLDPDLIRALIQPATAIALLAGIESLLSAVIADGMTGRRHDSDTELVAQGVANLVSPLFLGIPATGAIARTATNVKSGGRTPLAGIFHALALLAILMLFGKWASRIPMATLAAILAIVAWRMGEWRLFVRLLRTPKSDVLVLLTTFGLTVLVDLTVAIEVGVVLAALLFMRRMSEVTEAGRLTTGATESDDPDGAGVTLADLPPGVEVFEIQGPFFFGAADKFKDALGVVEDPPRVLVLRMRHVPAMDSTGLRALEDVQEKAHRDGTRLVLSGVRAQPRRVLERAGLLARIGAENVHDDLPGALRRAREIAEDDPESARPA